MNEIFQFFFGQLINFSSRRFQCFQFDSGSVCFLAEKVKGSRSFSIRMTNPSWLKLWGSASPTGYPITLPTSLILPRLPWWKNPPVIQEVEFNRWVGEGHGNPLQLFLPGESHGQRSLAGYSPWGRRESDMNEQLSMHPRLFSRQTQLP